MEFDRQKSQKMAKEARTISFEELKEHSTAKSLWMAIHDDVYDVTKFLEEVGWCSI